MAADPGMTQVKHRYKHVYIQVCQTAVRTDVSSCLGMQPCRSVAAARSSTNNLVAVDLLYTLCLKNVPPLTCYNLYIRRSIATIFGKNVAEKVGNQNVLYFLTSPN